MVEYDPGTHDLKTLSLHYFEEPELRVGDNKHPETSAWSGVSDSMFNKLAFYSFRTALYRMYISPLSVLIQRIAVL